MDLIRKLEKIVGAKNVLDADQASERSSGPWMGNQNLNVKGIVMPSNTEEVSAIMALCNDLGQPVIAVGGSTNLTFALQSQPDDLLLSLEKMNLIHEIDTESKVAIAEAGVIIENLQNAVAKHQLLYPVDWGARGSAMVGGSIATNAGGIQVLRYGTTRSQVLGLEVVLPDGRILSSLNKMIKDNAGYNLKHLFIGSEGTLGIITKASLRLVSRPVTRNTAMVAVGSFQKIIDFKNYLDVQLMGTLSSFEILWQEYYQLMTTSPSPYNPPISQDFPFYILFEAQGNDNKKDEQHFQKIIATALEEEYIIDGAIAFTESDHLWFWGIRENVEIVMAKGPLYVFDVSLPIPKMEQYCIILKQQLNHEFSNYEIYIFGHLGDGNLHIGIRLEEAFGTNRHKVEQLVYDPLTKINGSITAEHGIGLEKKAWLHISRSETEIGVMKELKKMFDPNDILNRGKVL